MVDSLNERLKREMSTLGISESNLLENYSDFMNENADEEVIFDESKDK